MTQLSQLVSVQHRSVRSVNLEHDLGDAGVLAGYTAGEHVVDAVRRTVIGFQDGPRTRAWSITGPYGVGKSSFAHFLCSLLGPSKSPAFRAASKRLRSADAQLADTLNRERRRLGFADRGLIAAAVTAEREPILRTVARALWNGAEAHWSGPGRKPEALHRLHALTHGPEANEISVGSLLETLDALCSSAPVLLVIDELGKTLEYAADRSVEGDLFALQQIAERFSSSERMRGCVVTLQHLAFEDYLVGASELRRREWRKVHGRFEDVPFVSSGDHARRLVGEALELRDVPLTSAIRKASARAHAHLSLTRADDPAEHYPLHPAAASALPRLTARLGQHDRSLVAFLTSDAPHALPAFLAKTTVTREVVPFLRLHHLYDYFFDSGAISGLPGPDGALAREIAARIDDTPVVTPIERQVLKTVGVLNVVSGADGLLASADMIEEALGGPDDDQKSRVAIREALEVLTARSLLTFREFAGEYRVWQGSDFDVLGQLAAARERIAAERADDDALLDLVAAARPLRPLVARRHSQRHGALRYFESRYASGLVSDPTCTLHDSVGLVVHVLAESGPPRKLATETVDGRPLVVVWSSRGSDVREAALDVGAAMAVLRAAPELESDPVARREIRHRLEAAQAALAELIDAVLAEATVVWFREGKRQKSGGHVAFSRMLSDICDARYPRTPLIANEMLNRRELTSQGAKARRELLERMFTHETHERLGIEGFGPERAMYEAVLHETGLHTEREGRWGLGPPPQVSPVADVWAFVEGFLDGATDEPRTVETLFNALAAPPYGMKDGPLPVLLAAALQFRSDDVFLYQDGTFHPVVEPALIERLLKVPERFAVKRAALVGLRATVFEELRDVLEAPSPVPTRNATTLAVVRPLIALVRGLPPYATTTRQVSDRAQRICAALLSAREPDELVFTVLPEACGVAPFTPEETDRDHEAASEYVARLRGGLAELTAAYGHLLDKIGDLLHEAFDVPGPRAALRENLRVRAETVRRHVIEPRMRAMLLAAAEQSTDEPEWLETLGMTLTSKPTTSWTDQDVLAFEAATAERAAWFKRLELLHFQLAAGEGRTFTSRRLTVTAPDGTEVAELVSVEAPTQDLIAGVLDDALAKLHETVGPQAQRALLGVLAERMLTTAAPAATLETKKANHA